MQECQEEDKSWHSLMFALILVALFVQYMALLHTRWTYSMVLHFGNALLHVVIDEISLSLLFYLSALMYPGQRIYSSVLISNLGCMSLLNPKI